MKQTRMFWAVVRTAIVVCWLVSCQKEEMQTKVSQEIGLHEPDTLRIIKLGKKLENPYAVKNMRRAF